MPIVFSYGALQEAEVQRATFGRLLEGREDELPGFERALVAIEDASIRQRLGRTHHDNVLVSEDSNNRVRGTALHLSEQELVRADAFEAPYLYSRVEATLASGKQAWVYMRDPAHSS